MPPRQNARYQNADDYFISDITEPQLHAFLEKFNGWTPTDTVKQRTAWVWKFGLDFQLAGKKCWICKICAVKQPPRLFKFVHAGLSNATGHLYSYHQIKAPLDSSVKSRSESNDERSKRSARTIETFMNVNTDNPADIKILHKLHSSFNKPHFQRLLVEWIVDESLPFRIVESDRFRALCCYLNPEIESQQALISRSTIRRRIIDEFHGHQQHVIDVLQLAPGQIHFAFDGWRSGNRKNVYGLACFFRDEKTNQPRKIVLGMPEIAGSHDGQTIGAAMVSLINQYQIGDKVGYFTLDNASNMDTAMDYIGDYYGFDGRRRRGRCFGHILNLVAKALLDPVPGATDSTDEIYPFLDDDSTLTDAQYCRWRKQGPVGKLRILVIAIDQSDQLNDIFLTAQRNDGSKKPLQLVKDNQTRWLGTYYMIKRALKLREYMEVTRMKFQRIWTDDNTQRTGSIRPSSKASPFLDPANHLSDNDWLALSRIASILKDFEDCIIQLEGDGQIRSRPRGFEGSYGNIYQYLYGLEFILQKLEQYNDDAVNYPDPTEYKIGINAALGKVNIYYSSLQSTPIYYAAHIFHPAYRWGSLERLWPANPEWVSDAKKQIKEVWKEEYKGLDITSARPAIPTIPQPTAPQLTNFNFNSFMEQQCNRTDPDPFDTADAEDEYMKWYQLSPARADRDVVDPIAYWHSQRELYPRLSRMALDFLTIQSMSAECERLFSSTGRLLSDSQSSLDIEIVNISMILRSWYRAGLVKDIDPIFISISEEAERHVLGSLPDDEAQRRVTHWLHASDR